MTFQNIDSEVNTILSKLADLTLPIKVDDIARSLGLRVLPYPLDNNVSGLLVIEENGKGIIGYNQSESRVRRRFTIAHELGHFILHGNKHHLFVDKEFKEVRFNRSHESAKDSSKRKFEIEANAFAASILMPETFLRKEFEKIKIDLGHEDGMLELAKKFDVSVTAMYIRLTNLELI